MAREESEPEVVGCCGMIIAVMKDYMLLLNISFGARALLCLGPCIEFLFLCCFVSFQSWYDTVKCFCDVLITVPEFVLQGGYDSIIANVVVASGETAGGIARRAGDLAGEVVTGACEVVKGFIPHAMVDSRPLTPNGKMERTLHWYR